MMMKNEIFYIENGSEKLKTKIFLHSEFSVILLEYRNCHDKTLSDKQYNKKLAIVLDCDDGKLITLKVIKCINDVFCIILIQILQ